MRTHEPTHRVDQRYKNNEVNTHGELNSHYQPMCQLSQAPSLRFTCINDTSCGGSTPNLSCSSGSSMSHSFWPCASLPPPSLPLLLPLLPAADPGSNSAMLDLRRGSNSGCWSANGVSWPRASWSAAGSPPDATNCSSNSNNTKFG